MNLSSTSSLFNLKKSRLNLLFVIVGLFSFYNQAYSCTPPVPMTQSDIDNFSTNFPGCTHITGNVILGPDVTDLSGLSSVITISNFVSISGTQITSLDGLHNLAAVGFVLEITNNDLLQDLTALDRLRFVNNTFVILDNERITSFAGLENFFAAGTLIIRNNPSLTDVSALENMIFTGSDLSPVLQINGNTSLSSCDITSFCDLVAANRFVGITVNDPDGMCNSTAQVRTVCAGLPDQDGDGFDISEDCDDTDPQVNPGQTEVTYNGIDDDCDPSTLDDDLDLDGFVLAVDCDDTDPSINPDAEEIDDGIDNNCDGAIDVDVEDYCTFSGISSTSFWIDRIDIGSISNTSGNDGGYGNYSNLSTDVEERSRETITMFPGFSGGETNVRWTVWIDWNQDGDFDDSRERVVRVNSRRISARRFNIPNNALRGRTLIRVGMNSGGFPSDSCDAVADGEVEDYVINILDPSTQNARIDEQSVSLSRSLNIENSNTEFRPSISFSKELEASVFPNPTSDILYLELDEHYGKQIQVVIVNCTGQSVYNNVINNFNEPQLLLSTQEYQSGLYFLHVRVDQLSVGTKSFVVQR